MNPVDNSSGIPVTRSEPRTDRRSELDGRANRAEGAGSRVDSRADTARSEDRRGSAESVSLTQTAAELLQLEEQLRTLPSVDQARVEAVRQAIADGTYEVDAEAVVDSLLRSDREFA
jgi:negative regulator of flagellin synthesis FlgM